MLLIILLSLFLLALVAAPLFVSRLNEPLPDLRDPVMVDLEEERDALLRAIHELDNRADLARSGVSAAHPLRGESGRCCGRSMSARLIR